MSVQTITLPSISTITKHLPIQLNDFHSSNKKFYSHPSPPPSATSAYYFDRKPFVKMEEQPHSNVFAHQPPHQPNSSISERGIHCLEKSLLTWDDLAKLLANPDVESYIPSGHPLTLAISCLRVAETWKLRNVPVNGVPASTPSNFSTSHGEMNIPPHHSSTSSNGSLHSRPQTSHSQNFEASSSRSRPQTSSLSPSLDQFSSSSSGNSTRSMLPPLAVQIPLNGSSSSSHGLRRPTSSGRDLETPTSATVSPSIPTPISSLSPSNNSPSLSSMAKSEQNEVDIQKANEALEVFWDPKISRPVPAGHSGDGTHQRTKEPSPDCERLYFGPESHYRVFRSGIEVFPWDGIGPGNDWLRGQLSAMNECRCGVFHFRHSNATFKRPAVIREHLASCNTSEAVPDSLRRLCILQRDAEKTYTKRKREDSGLGKPQKRPKVMNSSNIRSKPVHTPPATQSLGTPPASDEDPATPSR